MPNSMQELPQTSDSSASTGTTIKPRSNTDQPLATSSTELVTPTRTTNSPSSPLINDPTLQSTWSHRAWIATGCTTLLISLVNSIVAAGSSHIWLEPMLAGYFSYILAELGSGVYHWGIDNYGDKSKQVFGTKIEALQGHHKWPWTITRSQSTNNLHALARAITFTVLPIDIFRNDLIIHGFVSLCSGCIVFSRQFLAWAHGAKSKLPMIVVALQDAGALASWLQHAAHQKQPYNNNYCIVSGVCNEFLDKHKVFEALEMILFFKLGARPESWSEPNSEWIEETDIPPLELQFT